GRLRGRDRHGRAQQQGRRSHGGYSTARPRPTWAVTRTPGVAAGWTMAAPGRRGYARVRAPARPAGGARPSSGRLARITLTAPAGPTRSGSRLAPGAVSARPP